MARVNGRVYRGACSDRHHAVLAEMPVALRLSETRQAGCLLSVPVLGQPNRRIRARTSGEVGGALREGRIPKIRNFDAVFLTPFIGCFQCMLIFVIIPLLPLSFSFKEIITTTVSTFSAEDMVYTILL